LHLFLTEDSQLPLCNGKYFPEHSHVQAKEHRNVMQVLPHILHGIESSDRRTDYLTQLAIL
jgi:hypothetical protein